MAVKQNKKTVTAVVGAMTVFGAGFVGAPVWAADAPSSGSNDLFRAAAVCVGNNGQTKAVEPDYKMYVDGVEKPGGAVSAAAGSVVRVDFRVPAGCDPTKFGLAAYNNPIGEPEDSSDFAEQTYMTQATPITRSGGQSGTLTLTLPTIADCFYQVDFFTGDVITDLGPSNFYSMPGNNRLINVLHVERPNCLDVDDTIVDRPTTTVAPTTTSTSTTQAPATTPPTTGGPGVQPDEADRPVTPDETPAGNVRPDQLAQQDDADEPTTANVAANSAGGNTTTSGPGAQVLAEDLARTGTDSAKLAGFAAALALIGGSLRVAAVAARRRRQADNH